MQELLRLRKEAGGDDTTPHVIDLTDSPPTTPRLSTSTDQPQSGPPAISAHNVSIRQHTSAYVGGVAYAQAVPLDESAYVSIRQHTSAYVAQAVPLDELDERTLVASDERTLVASGPRLVFVRALPVSEVLSEEGVGCGVWGVGCGVWG